MCGQQGEDAADVVDEAHVEHPVGLVEDEDLDLAEVERAAAGMVEQSAGRRDDDLDATEQVALLRRHGHAAVDDGRAQPDVASVDLEARRPTWTASSRVGVTTSTRTGCRAGEKLVLACALRRSRMGSAKAAVLPVPVWARARRS